jgi:hypothetical protein
VASDIPLNKLMVSAEQLMVLEEMYRPRETVTRNQIPVDHLFKLDDGDQLHAAAIMVQHGLDLEVREVVSPVVVNRRRKREELQGVSEQH